MSPDLKMTAEEYAIWERGQEQRHEFYDGEVFSQAGGTRRHSLIGMNIACEIGIVLKGQDCEVHGSNMRVHLLSTGY